MLIKPNLLTQNHSISMHQIFPVAVNNMQDMSASLYFYHHRLDFSDTLDTWNYTNSMNAHVSSLLNATLTLYELINILKLYVLFYLC